MFKREITLWINTCKYGFYNPFNIPDKSLPKGKNHLKQPIPYSFKRQGKKFKNMVLNTNNHISLITETIILNGIRLHRELTGPRDFWINKETGKMKWPIKFKEW